MTHAGELFAATSGILVGVMIWSGIPAVEAYTAGIYVLVASFVVMYGDSDAEES